jgi:hypothetical protein
MLRYSQLTVCAIALLAAASAQDSPKTLSAERVRGEVKHAGIYHVSTGTWTRSSSAVAGFGPDTIYSNTAESGYFSSAGGNGDYAPGSTNYDEGNVPSSSNTNNPGNRDEYSVNCVEIGYCDFGTASSGWELGFYSSYSPCTFDSTPDTTVRTGALPSGGCWTMTLDLSGGAEFCLAADGGNGFDDDQELDAFGWSFRYTGDAGTADEAGFLLAGDPQSTDPNYIAGVDPVDGTNTYFGPASLCSADAATGLQTQDFWFLQDPNDPNPGGPGGTSNCYWFGGYGNNQGCGGPLRREFASWHLELQADVGPCNGCGSGSCGNPCLSNPNSTGVNSTMTVTGSTSIAADDVTLTATVPPNVYGFFITAQTPGFTPNPGGSQGNLCLGADIGRFQELIGLSDGAGQLSISTATGQWSVSSIPQGSGPYAAQVGAPIHFQCWHRDAGPMSQPTSNLTDSVTITWTM